MSSRALVTVRNNYLMYACMYIHMYKQIGWTYIFHVHLRGQASVGAFSTIRKWAWSREGGVWDEGAEVLVMKLRFEPNDQPPLLSAITNIT